MTWLGRLMSLKQGSYGTEVVHLFGLPNMYVAQVMKFECEDLVILSSPRVATK